MNRIYIFIFLTIVLSACYKVIDVDLNDTDPKIVVDAYVETYYGSNNLKHQIANVKLTNTSSFFEDNIPKHIDGVKLYVTNDNGDKLLLDNNAKGLYKVHIPIEKMSDNWNLSGTIEGTKIEASTSVASYITIDSISAFKFPFGPPKKGLTPICFFTDKAGESNYYRLRIWVNYQLQQSLFITRDDGQDGKQITFPFIKVNVYLGDTLRVDLMSINKFTFDYYMVFAQNMGGGGFSAAPGNPISNIKGKNAIGVFTGQSRSSATRIIKL